MWRIVFGGTSRGARLRRWGGRLGILLLLLGALFFTACIGCPQAYDTPLVPEKPGEQPVHAADWSLRIACFNTWILPWFSDEYDERLAKIPDALVGLDADIIVLQEVWNGGARDRISKAFGPEYVTARCDGGGMMLLSRYPIRSERFTPFGFDWELSLPEWFAKKGVMEVVLDTPVGPVRVVNAHLALQFGEAEGKGRQFTFLLSRLAELDDLPLILGADLNIGGLTRGTGDLDPDYLRLLAAGLEDLSPPVLTAGEYDAGPPTRIGWPREAPRHRGWHPDHLMVRDGPAATIGIRSFDLVFDTPQTALSDHNLLLGDIVIEKR